jgi:small subunit ribosomal protein S2
VLDTNSDPEGISFPIPGNDDAARAIQLYCDLVADSVLDGLTEGQAALGVDIGAAEAPVEPSLRRSNAKAAAAPAPEPEPEPAPEAEPEPVVTEAEMSGESDTTAAAADEATPASEPAAEG